MQISFLYTCSNTNEAATKQLPKYYKHHLHYRFYTLGRPVLGFPKSGIRSIRFEIIISTGLGISGSGIMLVSRITGLSTNFKK